MTLGRTQGPEFQMEKALLKRVASIAPWIMARRQVRLPSGRLVDVLAVLDTHPVPLLVVIEIKAQRAQLLVLEQLLGYMDEVAPILEADWPGALRLAGIIAAPSFGPRLVDAIEAARYPITLIEWAQRGQG